MGNRTRLANLFLVQCLMISFSCHPNESTGKQNLSYIKEINNWRNRRIASLKDKNGWLSLAGLFWLEEGENSFGSDQTNDIIFPTGKAPDFIGSFVLEGEQVRVKIRPDVKVLLEGEPVHDKILQSNEKGTPTILSLESLSWYIIKRGEKLAVRLKDSENPRIKQFKGINSYPIDSAWRIPAHFEPFEKPTRIRMATVLGTVEELTSPGVLVFEIQDKTYQLDAIAEPDDDQFWVVFADQTNGESTYGGGRYLYVDKPGADDATIIDFNKAYNPPCVFSEFATCALPHQRNRLPVKITAGEKNYESGSH